MTIPSMSGEEVERRATQIYNDTLRSRIETSENIGKVLVIDAETGEYELDTDEMAAVKRAAAKRPGAPLWALRVGYEAMHSFGGGLRPSKR